MPPREIFKMRTLGDAFSLILGAKSRAFSVEIDIVIEPCMLIYSDVIAGSSRLFYCSPCLLTS